MRYEPTLFPTLRGRAWAHVDLGRLSRRDFPARTGKNMLLEPPVAAAWVDCLAAAAGADFTYGGWLEDRAHLWRGLYDDAAVIRHLGVDCNVPAGTPVVAPCAAVVAHAFSDASSVNGWGGRLMLRLTEPWRGANHLIVGHLDPTTLPEEGAVVAPAGPLGRVAAPRVNGGWFSHLHVQCASDAFVMRHAQDLRELDGYVLEELARDELVAMAPDPTLLVGREI